jgi:hypothetical protein
MSLSITLVDPECTISVTPGEEIALSLQSVAAASVTLALPGSISGPVGPAGPTGPQGIQGEAGPQGEPGVVETTIWTQSIPLSTWTIDHNLGRYPSIEIIDSSGRLVEGDVTYPSANRIVVAFIGAFAGLAYLN